jgi:hypothetical protein
VREKVIESTVLVLDDEVNSPALTRTWCLLEVTRSGMAWHGMAWHGMAALSTRSTRLSTL